MNYQAIPLVAILAGVVLIISSFAWAGIQSGGAVWTEADEAEYSAATEKWRALGHSHGPRDEVTQADATRITADFNEQREKFERSANRGRLLSNIFWWSGLLLLVIGAGVVFVQRMSGDES